MKRIYKDSSKPKLGIKTLIILCVTSLPCCSTYAKSSIESIGDYTQVIIPAYAFGLAMNEPDYTGAKQFAAGFISMEITVNGLKQIVHEKRPDHSDSKSFPSGHSASAFAGAAFIHKRYGIKRAIIPYLAAGFTGFSRVYAKRHHVHDCLAGAAIGGLFGYFMTSRLSDTTTISPEPMDQGLKLNFAHTF